jgi:hypothetical protein
MYDQTVVLAGTAATQVVFSYMDIDRLDFISSGGNPVLGVDSPIFTLDNLSFEFIPEPSSLLLATFGALVLWPLLKRKRT